MTLNDFSYRGYKELLNSLFASRRNVQFKDWVNGEPDEGYLILRHDVDFSPDAACRMAELEAKLNIKATYFILLSSPYYNLLCEEFVDFPRRVVELGHEVGLHYDVKAMEKASWNGTMADLLHREIDVLSHLAGTDVLSIAMHNPSLSGMDPFRETRFVNAYSDTYTRKISYFSDSCGAWRDEFAKRFEQNRLPMKLQLLIHPIFWSSFHSDRWTILDSFMQAKHDRFLRDARRVKRLWRKHDGVNEHDKRCGSEQVAGKCFP